MSKPVPSESLLNFLRELPDVDAPELLKAYEKPFPQTIRVNTLKISEQRCLDMLRGKGVRLEKIPWGRFGYYVKSPGSPSETMEHALGFIYLQGPVSMLAAELLDVTPGLVVLDMCAAPGSKSTQIAQLLQGEGVLVANDVSVGRMRALAFNLQRCGVLNSVTTLVDGRSFGRREPGLFDRVLVDAPCSSLGIVSRDWRIAKRWKEGVSERLSHLQLGLILSGFDALRPGGAMVYATCTFHPLENEHVVNELVKRRAEARIREIKLTSPPHLKALDSWEGVRFEEEVEECVRIYPHQSGAEGFFLAKIEKIERA